MRRFGLPLQDLPHRTLDAVEIVERNQGRTVLLRDGQPVAALVSIDDLDRADPPDPGLGGVDPLVALCGKCRADWFVDQVLTVYGAQAPTPQPHSLPPPVPSSGAISSPLNRTAYDAMLPPRSR